MRLLNLYIPVLIFLYGCNNRDNSNRQVVNKNQSEEIIAEKSLQANWKSYIEDNIVYLYDSILPTDPLDYILSPENIEKNISFIDSINKERFFNENTDGNILTYYFQESYIKIFERVEDDFNVPIEFIFFDKRIKLKNGLKVGLSRESFNIIYPEFKQYDNYSEVCIIDESQFTNITCYFKADTIHEIFFCSVEVINQLNLSE
jgi:hypothetical protein